MSQKLSYIYVGTLRKKSAIRITIYLMSSCEYASCNFHVLYSCLFYLQAVRICNHVCTHL